MGTIWATNSGYSTFHHHNSGDTFRYDFSICSLYTTFWVILVHSPDFTLVRPHFRLFVLWWVFICSSALGGLIWPILEILGISNHREFGPIPVVTSLHTLFSFLEFQSFYRIHFMFVNFYVPFADHLVVGVPHIHHPLLNSLGIVTVPRSIPFDAHLTDGATFRWTLFVRSFDLPFDSFTSLVTRSLHRFYVGNFIRFVRLRSHTCSTLRWSFLHLVFDYTFRFSTLFVDLFVTSVIIPRCSFVLLHRLSVVPLICRPGPFSLWVLVHHTFLGDSPHVEPHVWQVPVYGASSPVTIWFLISCAISIHCYSYNSYSTFCPRSFYDSVISMFDDTLVLLVFGDPDLHCCCSVMFILHLTRNWYPSCQWLTVMCYWLI